MQRISTTIDIAAPVGRVWAVLMDFPAYPEWNPFVRRLVGSPTHGAKLQVTVQPAGGRAMSFEPQVLACHPERELRWRGKVLLAGVFDGEHVFQLSGPTHDTCTLLHEEIFSGFLVPIIMRGTMKAGTTAGFEAMNRALKVRAESRDA